MTRKLYPSWLWVGRRGLDVKTFGFKTKHSTDMCVFLLKQAISYYNTRISPIFCVFLDPSKTFDWVNHYLLFQKLIVRNVPMCFVRLLVYWYTQ